MVLVAELLILLTGMKSIQLYSNSVPINIRHYNSEPIFYIPTREGIMSQHERLSRLVTFSSAVNRSIALLPFFSHHYPSSGNIMLCDIFILPPNINCINTTTQEIMRNKKCIVMGNKWEYDPREIGLDEHYPFSNNFDYKTVECVAGVPLSPQGSAPITAQSPIVVIFQPHYWNIFNAFKF